jgi:hypothetical protein
LNANEGEWSFVIQRADADGMSAAQGSASATGTDSQNIASGNAFSAPGLGGTAINMNSPYAAAFGDPNGPLGLPPRDSESFAQGFPFDEGPVDDPGVEEANADVEEANAEPPGSPIAELAEVPPEELRQTVERLDPDDQYVFERTCENVLLRPAAFDLNMIRVCRVVLSL